MSFNTIVPLAEFQTAHYVQPVTKFVHGPVTF